MTYAYLDERRENDQFALPDVEIFEVWTDEHGKRHNEFDWGDTEGFGPDDAGPCDDGWYYQYGTPGYIASSDPCGPYDTEELALEAAREDAGIYDMMDDEQ